MSVGIPAAFSHCLHKETLRCNILFDLSVGSLIEVIAESFVVASICSCALELF